MRNENNKEKTLDEQIKEMTSPEEVLRGRYEVQRDRIFKIACLKLKQLRGDRERLQKKIEDFKMELLPYPLIPPTGMIDSIFIEEASKRLEAVEADSTEALYNRFFLLETTQVELKRVLWSTETLRRDTLEICGRVLPRTLDDPPSTD